MITLAGVASVLDKTATVPPAPVADTWWAGYWAGWWSLFWIVLGLVAALLVGYLFGRYGLRRVGAVGKPTWFSPELEERRKA